MNILVVTLTDPWGPSHGGTLRTRAFLRTFTSLGHDVTCAFSQGAPSDHTREGVRMLAPSADPIGASKVPDWARRVKRKLLPMPTKLGGRNAGLEALIAELIPVDLVLLSTISQARYYRHVEGAYLWFDFMDVWSDFAAREGEHASNLLGLTTKVQQRYLRYQEREVINSASIVSAAGWKDAENLTKRYGRDVPWLPNPITPPTRAPLARAQRPFVAGFLANFSYRPNEDALNTIVRLWAPRLAEVGWATLVAGHGLDKQLKIPGIENLGPVETLEHFYDRVDITIAPIRLGGGMKVKVAESLVYGRPVVASKFAVDGFPEGLRQCLHIVDLMNPDFSFLESLIPSQTKGLDYELMPFTTKSFANGVEDALSQVAQ